MLCVRSAARGRLYCAAVVSASVVVGAGSQATAATYYWTDSEPVYDRVERVSPPRRLKPRQGQNPTKAHDKAAGKAVEKESAKPQGPLVIAVSINKQQVKVYDSNGLFTESPVSTGMKGHSTPMGVFSVIQKQKFHRSNIYSGAPMPFMQRITWSGVAMHAGVLPGYPASHGCIRMPASFAVKMYGLTRMGARVLVTPGEVAPQNFSHPLLAAFKAPEPTASAQPDGSAPPAAKSDTKSDTKSDKGAALDLDLRSSIGADGAGKSPISASLRLRTHTADAGNATGAPVSDAAPANSAETSQPADKAEQTDSADKPADPPIQKADEAAPEIPTKPGTPAVATDSADKPAEAAKSDSAEPAAKTAETPADSAPKAPVAADSVASDSKPADSKPSDLNPADSKPAETSAEKPAEAPAATKAADAPAAATDGKDLTKDSSKDPSKDQTRITDVDKPATPAKPELKRTSQVAIFISRKDGKLYVRQNFAPVFNTPVTIAPSDRPLGTHVFTAVADKSGAGSLRWSVVSLPQRSAIKADDSERSAKRKKAGDAAAESKPAPLPDSAAEALERINIPADVVAWLGEALSSGSSLIVSDQGINQGETGEGTEFILSLR